MSYQQPPYPPPQRPQQPQQPPPGWVQGGQPYWPQQQQPHPQHQQPYGAPRPEHQAGPRRRFRLEPMMVVAVLTLAVGLVLGWFAGRHSAQPDTLDPNKVEAGVTTILRNDYGVPNVSNMACPNHMRVQKDATYTCTFTAGSTRGSVDIIVRNDAGQYQVQGPRG